MYESMFDDIIQSGGSYGRGSRSGISNVYIGAPNQKGHGIGSFLGGLFRRILPLLKRGATAVGREALRSGVNVVGDVLERDIPIRDSIRARARESGTNLKRKAEEKLETLMTGSGYKRAGMLPYLHSSVVRAPVQSKRRKVKSGKIKKKKRVKRKTTKKRRKNQKNSNKRRSRKKSSKLRTVTDIFS